MGASWVVTPAYFLTFAFLCGVVGFRMGWRMKGRVVLPIAQGTLGWLAFLVSWSFLGAFWAAACVGAWCVGSTLAAVYVFVGRPREADERVIRARTYRATMLAWLETGRGPEARVGATVVQHARELIWYGAAAVISANFLSLVMGAILLNYMNAYVATLLRAATRTGRVLLLAWNVWSVVRVAAYVLLGAAAAAPVIRMMGFAADPAAIRLLAGFGAAGCVLDLVLKLVLSPPCGRALAGAVDLQAAKANRSSEVPLELHLD
jgi:hypothetical protein